MRGKFFNSVIAAFLYFLFLQSLCFAGGGYLGGTFFGAASKDSVEFIQVGPQGDIYVSGTIGELSLSNVNGFKTNYNSIANKLAYIARFDKDLKTLKAFTYIGDIYSYPLDFKVADNGDVYILSFSFDLNLSSNVPGYNTQYQNSYNMLIRFDSNLQSIKGYTYLYDIGDISKFDIASNGDIVIAGKKLSPSGNNTYNDDALIGILSGDLTQLKYSYSYGGANNDSIDSIYIDANDNIFVSGLTFSSDFPVVQNECLTNQPCSGTSTNKIFMSKFNMNLNLTKTVLVAIGYTSGAMTGDTNNIYLAIRSDSNLLILNNTDGTYHPVILKLDKNLDAIKKTLPINYSKNDFVNAMSCVNGKLFIGGSVYNDGNINFPFSPGAWKPTSCAYNVGMVLVLENDLETFDYATIIGGSFGADTINAIYYQDNILYTAGYAQSYDFPVGDSGYQTACIQGTTGNYYDGFITKFAPFSVPSDIVSLSVNITGYNVKLSWNKLNNYTGYILYYVAYPYTGNEQIYSIDLGDTNSISFDLWKGAAFYVAIGPYDTNNNKGNLSNIELIKIN